MSKTTKDTSKKKPAAKPKKNAVGRKSKYFSHVQPKLDLIAAWCRNGATDEIIYKKLGIGRDSFYTYKKQFSEFSEALKNGKDDIDDLVESALLKRALGFKESARKPMKLKIDKDLEEVVYVDEENYYPPDTTAQIFWLKNRRPDKWRNSDREVVVPEEDIQQADVHKATLEALRGRKINELIEEEFENGE